MKRNGRLHHTCLLAGILLATLEQSAAADDLNGAYIGANFGRARNSYDTGFLDSQLTDGAAAAGDTIDIDKRSTSRLSDVWSADVGYFFAPSIGVEAAFLHLGEIRYLTVGTVTNSGNAQALASTTEVTSHGPALSLIWRLPLAEAFEADLRLGDYLGKTTFDNDVAVGANSNFVAPSKSTSSLLAGIGAAYSIAGHYSIRLDYLRIQQAGNSDTGGKFNVNVVTAGLSYTF